ncbi:ATP synthase F1 subunit epsilon [Anoxybacter fermentans]|uniref:ATP synthase epsilon chain n=1 Tax=Anoxybacter fermentans TaxID=1323375 RepID=A0A3Q9HS18_9FIRM|nr:F0F1 ATP synthase subunit epsilon [Anoxybacter fermentans]AZR73995.1 ATP synthase F1 subunit epsilon [Anoxybacter fermentans]
MARTIAMDIITPERVVFSDEVEMVIVPALDGLLGVLPGHAPLITGIKIGVVKVKKDGEEFLVSTSGGIMEVHPDQIKMVVETAELPHEIDVERARRAKQRAEERLRNKTAKIDEARARAALERAIARLKAAGKLGE